MKQKIFRFSIVVVTAIIFLCGIWYYLQPRVIFYNSKETIEILSEYDAKSFIKKVRHGSIDDIVVKDEVDHSKLGEYSILYTLKEHEFSLTIDIVDTKPPIVTVKDVIASTDFPPNPEDFIDTIEDATATTVTFKNKSKFNKVQEYEVTIVVEDEGGNVSEVQAKANILAPDETAPEIVGMGDRTINYGEEVDLLSGIRAHDERDGDVEVTITDDQGFSSVVPGSYTITYEAKDKTGNSATATSVFNVSQDDGSKVFYLTFDDGPSQNTQDVLDILDKYDVKATFFVTGAYPQYASMIQDEHAKGHAIGLHTYSHKYDVVYSSESAYFEDLDAVSNVVYEQIGIHPQLIRFPGGGSNTISANYTSGIMSSLSEKVRNKGYQYYDWNSENGDGRSGMSADDLVETAISSGGDQDPIMMLMHDGGGSSETVKALPRILEHYKNKGYHFKAIDLGVSGFHHRINN